MLCLSAFELYSRWVPLQLKQTATATKTSVKKNARASLNFIALIPPRTNRQKLAFFSGVEF